MVESSPNGPNKDVNERNKMLRARLMRVLLMFDHYAKVDVRKTLETNRDVKRYTLEGGSVTLAVCVPMVIVAAKLAEDRKKNPFRKAATNEWTVFNGPFKMPITCHARSGSYISQHFSGHTVDSQWCRDKVPTSRQKCNYVKPGEVFWTHICLSSYPTDGVSILYRANDTVHWVYPSAFKASINSDMCYPRDGTSAPQGAPIPAGSVTVQYVQTENYTKAADDSGFFRREYFPTVNSYDGSVMANSTQCKFGAMSGWTQTRVQINPAWFLVIVTPVTWLDLCGNFGGMYGLVVESGGFVLACYWLIRSLAKVTNKSKKVQVTDFQAQRESDVEVVRKTEAHPGAVNAS